MPSDTVEWPTWKIPNILPVPDDLDITDLLIYERQRQEEQQRRDEAYLRLPLPEMPYRRPEPDEKDPELGVAIIRVY